MPISTLAEQSRHVANTAFTGRIGCHHVADVMNPTKEWRIRVVWNEVVGQEDQRRSGQCGIGFDLSEQAFGQGVIGLMILGKEAWCRQDQTRGREVAPVGEARHKPPEGVEMPSHRIFVEKRTSRERPHGTGPPPRADQTRPEFHSARTRL